MLVMAQIQVNLPPDMPAERVAELRAAEAEYAKARQREGKWVHLWRVAGRTANVSILNVRDGDELNEILGGLPLFPWLDIHCTPLAKHPSALDDLPPLPS